MTNPFKARAHQRDAQRALEKALGRRDLDAIGKAVQQGAKLRGMDEDGVPVLQRLMECRGDVLPLLKQALNDGAGIEDKPRDAGKGFAFTALQMAAWNGTLDQLNLFFQQGASITAVSGKDPAMPGLGSLPRWDRSTAAHLACHRQDTEVEVLQRLLGMGARVDVYDGLGYQPLHTALKSDRRARSTACDTTAVTVLLAAGANPNAPVRGARREATLVGDRPLHLAADQGNLADVRALLAAGADPILRDSTGRTPLQRAQSVEGARFNPVLIGELERQALRSVELDATPTVAAGERRRL